MPSRNFGRFARRWLFPLLTLTLAAGVLTLGARASGQAAPARNILNAVGLPPAVGGELRHLNVPGFGRVAYYASPAGTGRPLVLTHAVNAAASAYEMKPLWDTYAGTRPVYALEWPGFGQSDRPDVAYTPELMAQALGALVAELNTEVDVVALSLGGEFAARAARTEPRIRTLALISPSGLGDAQGPSQSANGAERSDTLYGQLRSVGDPLFWLIHTRPSIQYFLSRSFRGPVPEDLIKYAMVTSHQTGAKHAPLHFISGKLFTRDAYTTLYAPLKTPSVVLFDQDGFVSFGRLPAFAAQPGNAAVRIPGTDGLPHWEKLPEVRAALEAFWAQDSEAR